MNINFNSSTNFNGSFDYRFRNSAIEAGKALKKTDEVKNYLLNVQNLCDDATEFAKDWHSTFIVRNEKLGNAEIGLDTKIKASLYPADTANNTFNLLKYFTPKTIIKAEADLFRDFVIKNGLENDPIKALELLKDKKFKPSTYVTFCQTAIKMQKEL